MKYEIIRRPPDWHVHEHHWCDQHQVIEYSEMWSTAGYVTGMRLL
jgi:hypothetical protein